MDETKIKIKKKKDRRGKRSLKALALCMSFVIQTKIKFSFVEREKRQAKVRYDVWTM